MKTEHLYKLFIESSGVSTDSRSVGQNQIFFALWGGNFNGNEYAQSAIEKGASWAVIDDPAYETDRTILVDDCLLELQALAAHHRKQMNIPVLAITGTNGKTTTKELIASVLSKKYRTHFTKGNLNNHIGVPLTILSTPADARFLIVEMGANHPGEIKTLCQIAQPGYGMITNIGKAHIEGFGSFEGIVRAKTELYEYLRKVNGVALYNDMDQLLAEKIFRLVNRAAPYSDPAGIPLEMETVPSGLNLSVSFRYSGSFGIIKTNLFGEYNLWNVKAAFAAGLFFDVEPAGIVSAIEEYVPANNRSQVKITTQNTVICDSYNANPSSMHSAIRSFLSAEGANKMVILGDMLELGDRSDEEHMNVLVELRSCGFTNVLLAGRNFRKAAEGDEMFKTFPDAGSLRNYLMENPVKGYTILVKGSRGLGLEKIYDLL